MPFGKDMVELLRYEPGIYALDAGYLRPQLAAIYLVVEGGRVAVVDTATNACLPATKKPGRTTDRVTNRPPTPGGN